MKPFKYLTVLDFEQGEVCQYPYYINIDDDAENLLKSQEDEDIELRLTELGHNLTNCEWMIHKNKPIIH